MRLAARLGGAARQASYSKKVTLLQIKFKSVYLLSKPLLKIGSVNKAGCFDIESSSLLAQLNIVFRNKTFCLLS